MQGDPHVINIGVIISTPALNIVEIVEPVYKTYISFIAESLKLIKTSTRKELWLKT